MHLPFRSPSKQPGVLNAASPAIKTAKSRRGQRNIMLPWPRNRTAMMTYETFCGGIFETNCYLVEAPEGWMLFDAPDGACNWLESRHVDVKLLLLTHGHYDHVPDAAKIKRLFNCQIGCHPQTEHMISDPEVIRSFGFALELAPVKPDFLIEETPAKEF